MSLPQSEPAASTLQTQLANIQADQRTMAESIRRVEHLLTGNGEPEKGFIVRLDRIEERARLVAKVAGAAIVLAATAIGAWLKSHW